MNVDCAVIFTTLLPAMKAGVAFEDLPDDWECPLCGAGKEEFKPAE